MTTPAFNPINTLFNSVRYYTQFDPYYYTVDNRPLTDMSNNSTTLSAGVDAARRAVLMEAFNRNLKETAENSTANDFVSGLNPSTPSSLTIRLGVGEILTPISTNNSISQVILKRGINQSDSDLTFTAPGTVGQSVVYTVEYKYVDIGATTNVGTYFFDNTNSSLFDTSLNGTLIFQLKQGTPDTTGNETVPSTTSGWSPLYNFHVSNGSSTWYKIYFHANAPKLLRRSYLSKDLSLRLPASNAGTAVTTYDPFAAWQLAEGSDQSIVATINLDSERNSLNLYKDIKFDVTFACTSATVANFAFQLSYATVTTSGSLSALSFSINTLEAIATSGTANTLSVATIAGIVPGSALNVANAKLLVLKFTRPSAAQPATDTSTGNMIITGITAYQSS